MSKYRSKRTKYNGVSYASKAEAKRASVLDLMARAGDVAWWIAQPKFRLGCPENVYVPDFLVARTNGGTFRGRGFSIHAEDVKGHETQKFKRDKRLWRRYGPFELHIIKPGSTEVVTPVNQDPADDA